MCKQIYGWFRLETFLFSLNPRQMPSLDFWSEKVSQKMRWFAEPGQMPGSSQRSNSATVAKSTALCFSKWQATDMLLCYHSIYEYIRCCKDKLVVVMNCRLQGSMFQHDLSYGCWSAHLAQHATYCSNTFSFDHLCLMLLHMLSYV